MRRMIGGWIACMVCLCACLSAFAQQSEKDFAFLYVSQPRIGQGNAGAELRQLFGRLGGLESAPEFVVINGDLTAGGQTAEWGALRDVLTVVPQGMEFYALPGSSDLFANPDGKEGIVRTLFADFKIEPKGRGKQGNKIEDRLYQSFDVEGIHFVLLDATLPILGNREYAHLDTEQLNWLDRDLKRVKRDTPVVVFLNAPLGSDAISRRPIANEFELWAILRPHNLTAIFAADDGEEKTPEERVRPLNGARLITLPSVSRGVYYRIRLTAARMVIEERDLSGSPKITPLASIPVPQRARTSLLRSGFDDDGNPYLIRRHPVGTFEPRAVGDNPEDETGEYRIDEGGWQPMQRDARDVWRSPFRTEKIPVGIHTATVRITTGAKVPHESEIIFEVERDRNETTRRWATNVDNPIIGAPVLSGTSVYVAAMDDKLYALTTDKGRKRTLLTARGGFVTTPVLQNGTLFVGSLDHTLYAVSAESGRTLWKFETDAPILSSAAVAQEVVCVGGRGKVYGVDARSGKPVWSQTASALTFSSAATDGEAFYLAGSDRSVYAFDARTGTPRWKSDGSFSSTLAPVAAGSRILVVRFDGTICALDSKTGKIQWRKAATGGRLKFGASPPSVSGTTAYIAASDGAASRLFALNTADGEIVWQTPLGQAVVGAGVGVAPDGRSLAVIGVRGKVSVHDAQNGKVLWGYELGPGNVFSTPQFDGTAVYTATMANDVQALNAPTP
jgi:outer membrane protein assembly factor BamB